MEKIKHFIESEKGKDILTILIVVFVGIGSFFLGRLSKVQNSDMKIEYPANYQETIPASVNQANLSQNGTNRGQNTALGQQATDNYFASTRGHKYYSLGCSAGKTIKQENRIYFATSTEAEKAGYSLSSSCQ